MKENNIMELSYLQRVAINKLIRTECCNFYDGSCCYDRQCKQLDADHLLCKWFVESVLPSDKALAATLCNSNSVASADADATPFQEKACVLCGQPFAPNSNRARYCPSCALSVRRSQRATSARKRKG